MTERKRKLEPKFGLDMDFAEALERFAQTDPNEVAESMRQQPGGVTMALRWSKRLSRTDAQQPTRGYPVHYLRFTRAEGPNRNQTWFRQTFFETAGWRPGTFGDHAVEEANVNVHVTIHGQDRGVRQMALTHDPDREDSNNTPNTWLHYDQATIADLEAQDCTDDYVVVERDNEGQYHMTIQTAAPTPRHSPIN